MNNVNVYFSSWLKNSFIDFPGIISTVLFFEGCNLECPWCHNPEIVRKQLTTISFYEILDFILRRRGLVDGVVLSGGEPTINRSLSNMVGIFNNLNIKVKLDTNGLNPDILKQLKLDYIALDIKTSPNNYKSLGCKLLDCESRLKKSVDYVRKMGDKGEIRIPCGSAHMNKKIAKEISFFIEGVSKVFIQQLNYDVDFLDNTYKSNNKTSFEDLEEIREIISSKVGSCEIRNK